MGVYYLDPYTSEVVSMLDAFKQATEIKPLEEDDGDNITTVYLDKEGNEYEEIF